MLLSTRLVSTLNLKRDSQDNLNLFLVYLSAAVSHNSIDRALSIPHILSSATRSEFLDLSYQSLDMLDGLINFDTTYVPPMEVPKKSSRYPSSVKEIDIDLTL